MHGAAPHFQKRREAQINPSGSIESRTRALCSRRPTTHLRVDCARPAAMPAAHASIYSLLSRARGLDAASSGAAAANQCSWKQRLFVAARRHRRCLEAVKQHARRQLKTVSVRLAPGSITAHADSCEDYVNIGMANKAIQVQHAQIIAADSIALPTAFAEHTTNRSEFSLSTLATVYDVASCAALQARDHRPLL